MNEVGLTTELRYLALTALITALMMIPYFINRLAVRGLMGTLDNPTEHDKPLAPWAQRCKSAHANAVENLVVFAALVLTADAADISNEATAGAAVAYFWARLAHYIVYGFGVPILRTVIFAIAWLCLLAFAWQILT